MTTPTPLLPPSSASVPGPTGGSRRRWLTLAGAAVVTLLVLAVAYTALSPDPGRAPDASSAAGTSNAATAFTASTQSGEDIAIPGGRPSVVFFFSATCGTCGPGAQALAETQAGTPDANYVAVDVDPNDSVEDVREFLDANDASTLAYARDPDAALARAYQLTQLSTAVVLDAAGTEVFRGVDPTSAELSSALTEAGVE